MLNDNPNIFTGNPLDRAGNQRRNPDWVAAQRDHADAQMLVISKADPLIIRDTPKSRLSWLTLDALTLLRGEPELVLLGLENDSPRYAVNVTGQEEAFSGMGEFAVLRQAAPYLSPRDLSVAGQAVWLISWHYRHRHCAKDGGPTVLADGGFKRINPATGAEHFPRTDPVAIVLPTFGDEVCMGRGVNFPEGFFSAFAGFLEPCETLEECGVRELKEEAGLDVREIEYAFSQPWPFPSSLMVGFEAKVASKELTLDPDEIAEARWFSRTEIEAMLAPGRSEPPFAPPPFAIAHQLLKRWVCR
ncbi:NAD(+) diphosphatase [Parvularcula marina]|uniref:NAD(+) diphosphatase n=1 Tax=Parvularcula marina TaxID=2292771 RepID=A0A371RJ94_9PROT|nr:NAD(+) diphosphatase [Parvularcula marina]RFB05527.1 NAD(+) diphosphatase [Parvularcula marina]